MWPEDGRETEARAVGLGSKPNDLVSAPCQVLRKEALSTTSIENLQRGHIRGVEPDDGQELSSLVK